MNTVHTLPVVVIGAGPVGLAAAAHLIERGSTPVVLEAGDQIAAGVRSWGHVRMFSPWRYTVDSAAVRLLEAAGWQHPPADDLPTGDALIDQYLAPLAALPALRPHIRLNTRVLAISRRHVDKMKDAGRVAAPFVLHVRTGDDETLIEARAVIDASGTWDTPNPLGAHGLPAAGERAHASHIVYGIPDVTGADRVRYAGRRVLVVGSGHSAINSLLMLAAVKEDYPATDITWVMRGKPLMQVYGGGAADQLSGRGLLGTRMAALVDAGSVRVQSPFRITRIETAAAGVRVVGETDDGIITLDADTIIAATGSRPDVAMLRELRLDLDPSLEAARTLAPLIDPNLHSCGTVPPHGEAELRHPERDFYIVGMKSYGRAPTFLLATGYEQVRSVVAGLHGDWEAARDVQLVLPETGVCSTDLGESCCMPAASATHTITLNDIPTLPALSFAPALIELHAIATQAGADSACCAPGCCS